MLTIHRTREFDHWLSRLKDDKAVVRILARIDSAIHGNFGDTKPVGEGVFEMRIQTGPGYRLYYMRTSNRVYLLLTGGDKGSQQKDIRRAIKIAHNLREQGYEQD
jgi:putative addiction module killer protein